MSEAAFAQVGASALIVCATGAALPGAMGERWSRALLPAAVAAIAVALALRWQAAGQGPFLTLYEVVLSNVFSLGLISALAYARWPVLRQGAVFPLGVIALLAAWTLLLPKEVIGLPPSFDNPWLWAHVLSGKVFLGLYLVATGLAVRLLATRPDAATVRALDGPLWRLAALAFVFDSAMLVTGAAWADDAWGRYWGWDPLETSALLTWLALALLLHLRSGLRWPPRLLWVCVCAVFVLAFVTFFGLPFLSLAAHKGMF